MIEMTTLQIGRNILRIVSSTSTGVHRYIIPIRHIESIKVVNNYHTVQITTHSGTNAIEFNSCAVANAEYIKLESALTSHYNDAESSTCVPVQSDL